mmetsp:Transcript_43675/g.44185  ORF Transcript_43675/g.44185 Transcript_43675/m.44185 type:complete len:114 (-) Transcript_43675:1073-1414(-)
MSRCTDSGILHMARATFYVKLFINLGALKIICNTGDFLFLFFCYQIIVSCILISAPNVMACHKSYGEPNKCQLNEQSDEYTFRANDNNVWLQGLDVTDNKLATTCSYFDVPCS